MSNPVRKLVSAPALISMTVLIAMSCAFVFGVGGASSRVMQSYHGLHHSAYVYQIANGLIPPTNPSSFEMPANFYWPWHAWLALGVSTFSVTPFEMSLVSNALGLSGFLCGLWWALGLAVKNPVIRLAACGLPFFILNPLGLMQFEWRLASVWIPEIVRGTSGMEASMFDHLVAIARHHSSLQMTDQSLTQLFPRVGLLDADSLSDRPGHLINKFLNFNSFPLALAFFAIAQALLVRAPGRAGARAIAIGILTFGMALLSPLPVVAFGMTLFAALHVVGAKPVSANRLENSPAVDRELSSMFWPAAGSALGVVAALPFILPVASAYEGSFAALGPSSGLGRHAVALGWPLVPTFVLLLMGHWLRGEMGAPARIYAISAILYSIAALALVTPREDPNEYKFVLLCAFPASLLAVEIGRALRTRFAGTHFKARLFDAAAIVGLAGMTVVSVSSMALLYSVSPWSESEPFRFDGKVVRLADTGEAKRQDLDAAYAWLRASTPTNAYVLVEPVAKDEDLLPVVAQRRVVSQLESPFTHAIAHHAELVEANRRIVDAASKCRVGKRELAALRASPLHWGQEPFLLVELRSGAVACSADANSNLSLAFANDSFAVYRLRGLAGTVNGDSVVPSP